MAFTVQASPYLQTLIFSMHLMTLGSHEAIFFGMHYFYLYLYFLFYYCCAGWEYIVAFTKVLIMYQIYLDSPPPWLSFIPPPDSWNCFNRYHFCVYIHLHTLFLHHVHPPIPFPTTSPLSLVPTPISCTPLPQQDLFFPPVLQFCRRKKTKDNKRNGIFASLR
jgi:hypothetical protein